jgi:hypothetical protein
MKITLQKNCLEKNHKEVTLYNGCCCCCCCIFTPVGNFLAEAVIKKTTKHTRNLWLCFFINLVFAIGSALLGFGVLAVLPYEYSANNAKNVAAILVALTTYYFLLWQSSLSWLKDVTPGRRYFLVFIEWLLSLLLMAVFFVASIFIVLGLFMK